MDILPFLICHGRSGQFDFQRVSVQGKQHRDDARSGRRRGLGTDGKVVGLKLRSL
jgi:hypothetical protein